MIRIKPKHVRRATLATKLFPKLNTTVALDTSKIESADRFDGEVFCGGRSKNRDLLTHLGLVAEPNGSSTFLQLPVFRRSVRKLTNLVEFELEKIGAQETLMPTLIPQRLWFRSKRLERQEDALKNVYKLKDDDGKELLLGPTFEESMTELVGSADNLTDADLPLMLYQTSSKFRFEPNPRFGLIRSNEFLMNDLYSFDADLKGAAETYKRVSKVYDIIFNRLDLKCEKIESVTGNIGGVYSHEYQMFVSSGEDTVIKCKSCDYSCNIELHARTNPNCDTCTKCESNDLSKRQALELGHTFLLADTYSKPLSSKFINQTENKGKQFFHMGCYGLGLSRILGASIDALSLMPSDQDERDFIQLRWPNEVAPYKYGLIPPAKRSKLTNAGSGEFVQKLLDNILDSTSSSDILVEDQLKDGIGWRIMKLQALGIPNIVVIGRGFLNDPPEIELLTLSRDSNRYDQFMFTKDQLIDYITQNEK